MELDIPLNFDEQNTRGRHQNYKKGCKGDAEYTREPFKIDF